LDTLQRVDLSHMLNVHAGEYHEKLVEYLRQGFYFSEEQLHEMDAALLSMRI
jgi:hypothetical protein